MNNKTKKVFGVLFMIVVILAMVPFMKSHAPLGEQFVFDSSINIDESNRDYIVGDMNSDGEVDLEDTALVLRQALDIENLSSDLLQKAADVDKNGVIDLNDVNMILRHALDIESLEANETGNTESPQTELPIPTTTPPTSPPENSSTPVSLNELAAEVLRLTNIERTKNGLPQLSGDVSKLNTAAMIRGTELIDVFSHMRPDGSSCFTVFNEVELSYGWAGENIAMGQPNPQAVVDAWMNSDGHRDNILSTNFTYLGIGVDIDSSGKLYWVQLFTS